jgi:hypothetical protein
MKRLIKSGKKQIEVVKFMLLAIMASGLSGLFAQDGQLVTGKIMDQKNKQVVPFASVVLIKESDTKLPISTMCDENGVFKIKAVSIGKYDLSVSFIGYKKFSKCIEVENKELTDAGIIFLQDSAINIKETVVVGEMAKAKSENDKITFFMTKKMLDASSSGTDVLKLIPGIQIDLMQNISLEGSSNIQILVNGKECDKSFISQINPKQIEKVEVISKPSSNYDGNISGAINIILKKEMNSGISGQINAEIPTSYSEIYAHPSYTLNYGFKKWNLYTSYSGDLTYLNIHEPKLFIRK